MDDVLRQHVPEFKKEIIKESEGMNQPLDIHVVNWSTTLIMYTVSATWSPLGQEYPIVSLLKRLTHLRVSRVSL